LSVLMQTNNPSLKQVESSHNSKTEKNANQFTG